MLGQVFHSLIQLKGTKGQVCKLPSKFCSWQYIHLRTGHKYDTTKTSQQNHCGDHKKQKKHASPLCTDGAHPEFYKFPNKMTPDNLIDEYYHGLLHRRL